MTTLQLIFFFIGLMIIWLIFQIALEFFKTQILVKRQEEIVDKTISRIYDQVCRHGVQLFRDVKDLRREL